MLNLVMEPTQLTLTGFAVVVLNEVNIQAGGLLEILFVKARKEKAAVISKDLRLQNQ